MKRTSLFIVSGAAPEPLCVLALDQQLIDLERFCTCDDEFSILGFDPWLVNPHCFVWIQAC